MSGTRAFDVAMDGKIFSFTCFDNQASYLNARAVLGGETYARVDFLGDVKTIVDVGANVGSASVYFALYYPTARIFSFEPGHAPYELLARNTASFPQVRAFNFGLFDREARPVLHHSWVDAVTASVGQSHLNVEAGEEILLREARTVLDELKVDAIDILKIDTEGCELPIFRSLGPRVLAARVIYVEYHSEGDRLAIDGLLRETHILFGGKVIAPHLGEFCYVSRIAFPDEKKLREKEIVLPADLRAGSA